MLIIVLLVIWWISPHVKTENLALNKLADQTGVYGGLDATRAVDGVYGSDQQYCAHPDNDREGTRAPAEWWVDLNGTYLVDNVTIYNTYDSYGSRRLEYFIISVGMTLETLASCNGTYVDRVPPGGDVTIVCTAAIRGRYVHFRRVGGFQPHLVTLCEVEVYGRYEGDTTESITSRLPPTTSETTTATKKTDQPTTTTELSTTAPTTITSETPLITTEATTSTIATTSSEPEIVTTTTTTMSSATTTQLKTATDSGTSTISEGTTHICPESSPPSLLPWILVGILSAILVVHLIIHIASCKVHRRHTPKQTETKSHNTGFDLDMVNYDERNQYSDIINI